jgi:hypothetical protein
MNISEIITNPARDEYLDQYLYTLKDAIPVAKIKDLELRKSADAIEINYGLFDKTDRMIGYFSLEYAGKQRWQVTLVQLAQAYKGQGYGTFFYDYAVMNDKLTVVADGTNTGGPHGSKNLWTNIWKNARYEVKGINLKTGEIFDVTDPESQIYNSEFDTRWIAFPPNKTISESMEFLQSRTKKRHIVWYGPGTTTEYFFNH